MPGGKTPPQRNAVLSCFRSLPSWRTLQPNADGKELDGTVCSEQEMRALNSKEAVILITNLSTDETLIPQQEIITDVTQMRTVANVHESLVSEQCGESGWGGLGELCSEGFGELCGDGFDEGS